MDGNPIPLTESITGALEDPISGSTENIIDFYESAGLDYEHWSPGLNMHLGFYRRGINPFNREAMLEEMNVEVARRLQIDPGARSLLIDLGCGMGSIARSVARRLPNSTVKGVTVVPSHVNVASALNVKAKLDDRIEILQGNYVALPVADGSADGVWAVESACYAAGTGKEDLVREMARVLKRDGRFVVADCFLKCPESELNRFVRRCYRSACQSWALPAMPNIDSFVAALKRSGFADVIVDDISWRAAPSLAHAPLAVTTFLIGKVLAGERLNRHTINNLKASLFALVLGLNRSKFSYCVVSGRRGETV